MCSQDGASNMTRSPFFPISIEPIEADLLSAAAAFNVIAHKASLGLNYKFMHAKDIVSGKDKQWALGQKSDAKATGTPASNIFLTGGFLNFNIKWVVGNTTPTTYFYAMALIPSSDSWMIIMKNYYKFQVWYGNRI